MAFSKIQKLKNFTKMAKMCFVTLSSYLPVEKILSSDWPINKV